MKTIYQYLFLAFFSIAGAAYAAPPDPSMDPVSDPAPILTTAGTQTIQLTGLSDNNGNLQGVTVSALSGNTNVIDNLMISMASPTSSTCNLSYSPGGTAGSATIIVHVANAGFPNTYIERSFTVIVNGGTTSIKPSLNASTIKVYPNPGNGTFHLDLSAEKDIQKITGRIIIGFRELHPMTDEFAHGIMFFRGVSDDNIA